MGGVVAFQSFSLAFALAFVFRRYGIGWGMRG